MIGDVIFTQTASDMKEMIKEISENSEQQMNQDTKPNDNDTCIPESIIKKDYLLENISSNGTKNITNGLSCSQYADNLECKTVNIETTKADGLPLAVIDPKCSPPKDISKNVRSFTELEENSDEPLCKKKKTLLDDTIHSSASSSLNVPTSSLENNTDDITMAEGINQPSIIANEGPDTTHVKDKTKSEVSSEVSSEINIEIDIIENIFNATTLTSNDQRYEEPNHIKNKTQSPEVNVDKNATKTIVTAKTLELLRLYDEINNIKDKTESETKTAIETTENIATTENHEHNDKPNEDTNDIKFMIESEPEVLPIIMIEKKATKIIVTTENLGSENENIVTTENIGIGDDLKINLNNIEDTTESKSQLNLEIETTDNIDTTEDLDAGVNIDKKNSYITESELGINFEKIPENIATTENLESGDELKKNINDIKDTIESEMQSNLKIESTESIETTKNLKSSDNLNKETNDFNDTAELESEIDLNKKPTENIGVIENLKSGDELKKNLNDITDRAELVSQLNLEIELTTNIDTTENLESREGINEKFNDIENTIQSESGISLGKKPSVNIAKTENIESGEDMNKKTNDIKMTNKSESGKNLEKQPTENAATTENLKSCDELSKKINDFKDSESDLKINSENPKNSDEQNIVTNDTIYMAETETEVSSGVILETVATENVVTPEILENSNKTKDENKNDDDNSIKQKDVSLSEEERVEIEDMKIIDLDEETPNNIQENENSSEARETITLPVICKLSNTLDILSDDEEEVLNATKNISHIPAEKQCIDIDDDDDIVLIEEDSNYKDKSEVVCNQEETKPKSTDESKQTAEMQTMDSTDTTDLKGKINEKDTSPKNTSSMEVDPVPKTDNNCKEEDKTVTKEKPLLPQNILKNLKKNLAVITRDDLEDFCIHRIVDSIVDRGNLTDIKIKVKTMAQTLEDYKKRAMLLAKQYRDLQVVLKSIQEEQKQETSALIQPAKITRSVGMQVMMNDNFDSRRKAAIANLAQPPTTGTGLTGRVVKAVQSAPPTKPPATPPSIPVPRKVPVINSPVKPLTNTPTNIVGNKAASPSLNGLKNASPVQKVPEKRTHSRMLATSVTVDLTDDEPPAKLITKNSPSQPVRVVAQQTLLAPQRQFPQVNNARKVYIPISGPQAQQIRAGQTIVMKTPNSGPRPGLRVPMARPQQGPVRSKFTLARHPAPLPESMKQYTPPTWKPLPPAPDLKLSKVENGIVISWKIEGHPEGSYETIASYQLYAYQETDLAPSTALWKKIGDVKALPLPMACTLTQFMAGFKYYFAVRAIDIRSRMGPFSLPGSILLLNKV